MLQIAPEGVTTKRWINKNKEQEQQITLVIFLFEFSRNMIETSNLVPRIDEIATTKL